MKKELSIRIFTFTHKETGSVISINSQNVSEAREILKQMVTSYESWNTYSWIKKT